MAQSLMSQATSVALADVRKFSLEGSLLHILDIENWALVPEEAALDVIVRHLVVSNIFSGLLEPEPQAQNLRPRSQRSLLMIDDYF